MRSLSVSVHRKSFNSGRPPVLSELSFQARSGEILALVGPSGAGKTTLLNIIAGLDRDYEGRVSTARNGSGETPASDHDCRIGYMFQTPRLMPWLSVLENLLLVLDGDDRRHEKAGQLLAQVGLGDYLHAFPRELSGGMQRRVALTRAFAISPDILLLDEPFVSLDAPTVAQLGEGLLQLWSAEHPTILLVTHNLREALVFADRVLFLSTQPARIVLDEAVALTRPRSVEGTEVGELHNHLLNKHPDLLSGLVGQTRD